MIKADCRERLTAADFDFVRQTLARTSGDAVSLADLLIEPETRDAVLDHPRLVQSLLENGAPLSISPQLYFYILIRHVLQPAGLRERCVSDYVASLLERFSRTAQLRSPDGRGGPVQYLSDMLLALQHASPSQAFFIRAHAGNYALFLTGIFPELVQRRAQRGAPDVSYYEEMGRANFRSVATHEVARSCALSGIFETLAEAFHEIRLALNRLADSLLHLDGAPAPAGMVFG